MYDKNYLSEIGLRFIIEKCFKFFSIIIYKKKK